MPLRVFNWSVLVLLFGVARCIGQGTFTVTFDGPPTNMPPGGQSGPNYYYEAGMSFTPALPGTNFYRNWPVGGSPGNGTIFLFAGRPWQSLRFGFTNGTVFQMVSVDLGDFFALPNNVRFVGYMQGGGTVTTNFITGGNGNFQTFFFGQEFSNLDHVDMPNITFYLDNVTFKIPEPSVGGIFVLAALILGVRRLCIR